MWGPGQGLLGLSVRVVRADGDATSVQRLLCHSRGFTFDLHHSPVAWVLGFLFHRWWNLGSVSCQGSNQPRLPVHRLAQMTALTSVLDTLIIHRFPRPMTQLQMKGLGI